MIINLHYFLTPELIHSCKSNWVSFLILSIYLDCKDHYLLVLVCLKCNTISIFQNHKISFLIQINNLCIGVIVNLCLYWKSRSFSVSCYINLENSILDYGSFYLISSAYLKMTSIFYIVIT